MTAKKVFVTHRRYLKGQGSSTVGEVTDGVVGVCECIVDPSEKRREGLKDGGEEKVRQ